MALGEKVAGLPWDHTQDRNPAPLFDRFPEYQLMTLSGHLVQNDTGDVFLGIEPLATQHHGGGRSRHLCCVQNEDNRAPKKFGKLGGRITAVCVNAVVEPAVSFDEASVPLCRAHHK